MKCFLCNANCLGQVRHDISVSPGVSHLVCPRCVALCKSQHELEHKVRDKALEVDLAARGHEITAQPPQRGKPTDEQLANKFAHHAPFGDQGERYGQIRAAAMEFAKVVRDLTPCSPEQTRAINHVHESMMIANSAIAINEKPA